MTSNVQCAYDVLSGPPGADNGREYTRGTVTLKHIGYHNCDSSTIRHATRTIRARIRLQRHNVSNSAGIKMLRYATSSNRPRSMSNRARIAILIRLT